MKEKYSMDLAEIGARLRAVRGTLKLSMDRISDITGYSKALISAAENGFKKPSSIYLYAMYDKFNVNIHYIFSGKGPMFLDSPESRGLPEKSPPPPPRQGAPFSESDAHVREMLELMEHVETVRFAVLGYFYQYKTQNKRLIEEQLEEKRGEEPEEPEDPEITA